MPRTVITPPGRLALPSLPDLWRAREVAYQFGKRDILLRYRQTFVGVAWVLIQPLAAAGIFSIVFGQIAQLPSGGVPYFIFSLVGMLAWNLFNGIVSRAAGSLVANQALVSKVYFPRLLLPVSTAISVMIDFLVGLGLYIVLMFIFGIGVGWQFVLAPIWVLAALLMAVGVGSAAAALTVSYRDINYALPWLLQILFYATPVAYSLEAIPSGLEWFVNINPLAWLMEAFRWSLLDLAAPPLWQMLGLGIVSVLALFGGILVFQSSERGFADVI